MSKEKNEKLWNDYGTAFWKGMMFVSFALLILSVLFLLLIGTNLFFGDYINLFNEPIFWIILIGFGVFSLSLSIFCINIFPSWGNLVRRLRLSDARMEGAMSISEINRYEERENRRSSELKETVTDSVNQLGRDLVNTKNQLSSIEKQVQNISSNIQEYISSAIKDILAQKTNPKNLNNMVSELESLMDVKIQKLDESFQNLQTQIAFQNDDILKKLNSTPSNDSSSNEALTEETDDDDDIISGNEIESDMINISDEDDGEPDFSKPDYNM